MNTGRDDISDIGKRCIADLRTTNPRDDKTRIEDTKGGLLADSYIWVLDDENFTQWRDDSSQRLLWVKGDPGKGKTMLLCGIINHLESTPRTDNKRMLAYFFCQATDERINTATAVVRGLILMLLEQDSRLLCHIEKKYEVHGTALFDDGNAWYALSKILLDILQDPRLESVWLVVDALDECTTGRSQLLDLIVDSSRTGRDRIKWLISSRNWLDIEERLDAVADKVSLEFNAASVAGAVESYINHKVSQLAQSKKYKTETTAEIRRHLLANADGTFLWVALVCQELDKAPRWKGLQRVQSFPAGLDGLYRSMILHAQEHEESALCLKLVAVTTIAYIPLRLVEYPSLVEECRDMEHDLESLQDLIKSCGSFLTVRNEIVYFVHQSAKDYLVNQQSSLVFPDDQAAVHEQILLSSLQSLTRILHRDMYDLADPGICLDDIVVPSPDPLRPVAYSCIYWIDHFWASDGKTKLHLMEASVEFLEKKCLYWLESLSLLRSIYPAMTSLHRLMKSQTTHRLQDVVIDAYRVLQNFHIALGDYPLQTYATVLLFSPQSSSIRRLFRHEAPTLADCRRGIREHWSDWEFTYTPQSGRVDSVEFSPDDQHVLTSSTRGKKPGARTVYVWSTTTGACEMALEGTYGTYSPDGYFIATACGRAIKLWNARTGLCERISSDHERSVYMVKFSPCGTVVAFVLEGARNITPTLSTVRTWVLGQGRPGATFQIQGNRVSRIDFSADGSQILITEDLGVLAWDLEKSELTSPFALADDMRPETTRIVAVSGGGRLMLAQVGNDTLEIWDLQRGANRIRSFRHLRLRIAAFSADARRIASVAPDTVKIWNVEDDACEATFSSGSEFPYLVAFSKDGQRLALGTWDGTVMLSGSLSRARAQDSLAHDMSITGVSISPRGRHVVTASTDETLKIWDLDTGLCELSIQSGSIMPVPFIACSYSADGRHIISETLLRTVEYWDAATGILLDSCDNAGLWSSGYFSDLGWRAQPAVAQWKPYFEPSSYRVAATISDDGHWILRHGRRVIWLPPDFRTRGDNAREKGVLFSVNVSSSGVVMAIATHVSQVCIIHFERAAEDP